MLVGIVVKLNWIEEDMIYMEVLNVENGLERINVISGVIGFRNDNNRR